jgi:hypothetical protein
MYLPLAALLVLGWSGLADASESSEMCLACHEDSDGVRVFKGGDRIPLNVKPKELARSVHRSLDCTDCHGKVFEGDHPGTPRFADRQAFRKASVAGCPECHEAEGIHGKMVENLESAVCSDCHGGHDIQSPSEADAGCMGCHQRRLVKKLGDGTGLTLVVDESMLAESVHRKIDCADCHEGYTTTEHPEKTFADARAVTHALSGTCAGCHEDKQTSYEESIHAARAKQGDLKTPACADCHGSHQVGPASEEKIASARRCRTCHEKVYDEYAKSVHGAALVSGKNQDVPVCSDCHHAHEIADPTKAAFKNHTPETCGGCHANEEMMAKYGLSTAVLDSYLQDFHGVTASFYNKEGKDEARPIAVCSDCHGIHNINRTKGPDANVLKANLLARCQKCHPDATENFPDAWVSHYQPSWKRASLVYLVGLGYKLFIPFMMIGLILQILLHVWRYTVRR